MPDSTDSGRDSRVLGQRLLGRSESAQALLGPVAGALEGSTGVFLVGGAVRDLLLGQDAIDLDLIVEGDALAFADRLARALGTDARAHERFQTATIEIERDRSPVAIDVAAARTETYARPGALPDVELAGIGEDLARRDFTINAIAISVAPHDLGEILDPFGGVADIEQKRIRALHESSFIDDPTRLLRALRYESRLGFSLEPGTLRLASQAIELGAIGEMDSGRIRDELLDLLGEDAAGASLARMRELGLTRALHPRLAASPDLPAQVEQLDRLLDGRELRSRVDRALARLALACASMSPDELGTWLDRLSFGGRARDVVVEATTRGPVLGRELAAAAPPPRSKLSQMLAGRAGETLALAALGSEAAGAAVDEYLASVEPVELEITGGDLLAAGVPEGPVLGEALRAVLALKLDGGLEGNGKRGELAAALKIVRDRTSGP